MYGPAKLEWADERRGLAVVGQSLWLLGVDRRLMLLSAGDQPRVIWTGTASDVRAEAIRQLLATGCRLTGGQWQLPGGEKPVAIRLSAGLVASYAAYFQPLLTLLGHAPATTRDSRLT
jgi:hypothetical protein